MPFVRDSRIKGLVYIPDDSSRSLKKYPCPDCHSCQMCPDIRCELCLKKNSAVCIRPGGKNVCAPKNE